MFSRIIYLASFFILCQSGGVAIGPSRPVVYEWGWKQIQERIQEWIILPATKSGKAEFSSKLAESLSNFKTTMQTSLDDELTRFRTKIQTDVKEYMDTQHQIHKTKLFSKKLEDQRNKAFDEYKNELQSLINELTVN